MTSFDERAREWDTPERVRRAQRVAEAIRSAVRLDASMRVIEVGAGTGLLGLDLANEIGELVLADPSTGMLAVAAEKLAATGRARVRTLRFDLVADPPPGEPFDLAISLLVLHHVADTDAALAALHRLLKPGGWLALADLDAEDGSFHGGDNEGIHHLGFERTGLADRARAAGFTEVKLGTATELERDGRSYPLFLLTARRA